MNFKDKEKKKTQNFPHANGMSYKWNHNQIIALKTQRNIFHSTKTMS